MQSYKKEVIISDHAPKPIGPYSVGIRAGNYIFTAGQIGLIPETGEIVAGGIEAETRQALQNLQNVLASSGSNMNHVVKTTVYLRDMNDFPRMNSVYGEFFKENPPARSTIAVAGLPRGAAVEIEVIAIMTQPLGD